MRGVSIAPCRQHPGRSAPCPGARGVTASASPIGQAAACTLATLFAIAVLLPLAPLAQAQSINPIKARVSMPRLGNTPASDRRLLREVGDDQVFDATLHEHHTTWSAMRVADPGNDSSTLDSDVWDRIRRSGRLPSIDDPEVERFRSRYASDALWTSKLLQRGKPWLGYLIDELDKRYFPVELALLPAIESGFQPEVLSSGNAAGLWQIIPATARDLSLPVNTWYDARLDIEASTEAALDYLAFLNAEFHGDWLLTLAAYNAGLGRVRTAIERNRRAGRATHFTALSLPAETRAYVPKLLGLLALLQNEDDLPFDLPAVPLGRAFEAVDIGFRVSVDKTATLIDVPTGRLRRLNAALRHGVTPPDGPHRLYLPIDPGKRAIGEGQGIEPALERSALFSALDDADRARLYASVGEHVVVAGDTLSGIARRYGTDPADLQQLNDLEDSRILIGQRLRVSTPRAAADNTIDYVVAAGDTLAAIAERFRVNLGAISDVDGRPLSTDLIYPGDRLRVTVETLAASGPST